MAIQNNTRIFMAKHQIKTYGELAKKVNHPYSSVRGFVNGKHKTFNEKLVNDLCELFDCEVGELLYVEKRIKQKDKAGA